jgi:hypothetical protein
MQNFYHVRPDENESPFDAITTARHEFMKTHNELPVEASLSAKFFNALLEAADKLGAFFIYPNNGYSSIFGMRCTVDASRQDYSVILGGNCRVSREEIDIPADGVVWYSGGAPSIIQRADGGMTFFGSDTAAKGKCQHCGQYGAPKSACRAGRCAPSANIP